MARDGGEHLLLLLLGEFLGVPTGAFRFLHRFCLDERGTQTLDLLAHHRPNVERRHDRPQPPGGGDGLKPSDPGPDDERLGRCQRARRRREHGQELALFGRGEEHGLVPGNRGLGRQDIHRLCLGGSRHQLHGKGCDVAPGQCRIHLVDSPRLEQGHKIAPLAISCCLFQRRRLHLQDQVGIAEAPAPRCYQGDPGVYIGVIGEPSGFASTFLDHNCKAGLDESGGGGD